MASFSVTPDDLSLGRVEVFPQQNGEAVLFFENNSDCDANLTLYLEDADGVFSLPSGTLALPANGSAPLVVNFSPVADQDSVGLLHLRHGGAEPVRVWLDGQGLAPHLQIETEGFGDVAVGCHVQRSLSLTNTGRDELLIDGLELNADSAFWLEDDEVPWSLAPGASWSTTATFSPQYGGSQEGTLFVDSNDPLFPEQALQLAGRGQLTPAEEATGLRPAAAPVDVLVVANGDADPALLDAFSAGLSDLTAGLVSAGVDLRLAVVVQDTGVVSGDSPYLATLNVAETDTILSEMLGGFVGPDSDRILQRAERAVSANSWLRAEASLHVVAFSDVPDPDAAGWQGSLAHLESAAAQVTVHAFGGDYPGGCAGIEPLRGVYDVSVATDGSFHSICADLGDSVAHLGAGISALPDALHLPEAPIADSVSVTVGGEPYRGALEVVGDAVFLDASGFDPAAGVTVRYTPQARCGG